MKLIQNVPVKTMLSKRSLLWLAAVGILVTLLALLTNAMSDNSIPSQDRTVSDWIVNWGGVTTFFDVVSFVTSAKAGFIYGPLGLIFLLLLGKTRPAIVFAVVGVSIGAVSIGADYSLGQIVDRPRPLAPDDSFSAFPSGHVYGSAVFFGFIGFLAAYYRMKVKILIPLLVLFAALIVLVGPARIHVQAHWPSDVAASYLLAAISLLVIIPVFLWVRSTTWMSSRQLKVNSAVVACESCPVARSIASVVVLDPEEGTATKVYTPPPLVRLLYWVAFQAKFPYETNTAALESGKYRRQIASLLTAHRFGKDLVAPVITIHCGHGNCSFVTEFIPGEVAKNDEPAQKFLGEVSETFAEAGLSVWQVNPRNPHAHTNIIRTPEGDYKIIDLESAVVSLFPAPGQFRSSLKSGNLPIFDDIDFPRLRNYISTNEAALMASIGSDGAEALKQATDHAEDAINTWKAAEPRIFGHLIAGTYKLADLKARFQHFTGALRNADAAAQLFLNNGIDRWEKQGRIDPSDAAGLRARLSSRAARYATRHLGVHLVMSVAIAIPIPGMRSAARFLWTFTFWTKARLRRLGRKRLVEADQFSNIHTPLVMGLALVPALGGAAYLASPPLRSKLLARLMLDQAAWKLPFKLYHRTRIGRWLAPSSRTAALPAQDTVPAETPAREPNPSVRAGPCGDDIDQNPPRLTPSTRIERSRSAGTGRMTRQP